MSPPWYSKFFLHPVLYRSVLVSHSENRACFLKVARNSSAQASLSFNQASPAAIAVYSHVRHQPSSADIQHSSTLHRSKKEILRVLELMIEKTQQEVVKLLPDVSK